MKNIVLLTLGILAFTTAAHAASDCWCYKNQGFCQVGNENGVAGSIFVGETKACTLEECLKAWKEGKRGEKPPHEICPNGYPPVPTADELECAEKEITEWIKDHPEVYWVYDGCFERATDLYDAIVKKCPSLKDKINQQWLTGNLCPGNGIRWGHHTALCYIKDGKKMIIDPALGKCCNNGDPLFSYDDWLAKCNNQPGPTSRCEVTQCTGNYNALCVPDYNKEPWAKEWLKKAKCWFPCFGKLQEALKKCEDSADSKKCKADALSSCTSCGAEDKNGQSCKEIPGPFIEGTSGPTQTCEWAATFYKPSTRKQTSSRYENTENALFMPTLFLDVDDELCLLTDESALTGDDDLSGSVDVLPDSGFESNKGSDASLAIHER